MILASTTEQIYEVFAIANLVGGSICIPHTAAVINTGKH